MTVISKFNNDFKVGKLEVTGNFNFGIPDYDHYSVTNVFLLDLH